MDSIRLRTVAVLQNHSPRAPAAATRTAGRSVSPGRVNHWRSRSGRRDVLPVSRAQRCYQFFGQRGVRVLTPSLADASTYVLSGTGERLQKAGSTFAAPTSNTVELMQCPGPSVPERAAAAAREARVAFSVEWGGMLSI